MAELPEVSSPKAARILAATGDLLLGRGARGFTVADVAQKAHVGKGTVYLYWRSKEDLLLGLIVRDFVRLAEDLVAALAADPGVARPSRLCPLLVRTAGEHAFVEALQSHDELLGMLTEDPRTARLLDALGPSAVMRRMLPVWREHRLARTDWAFDDQAYALLALLLGFVTIARDRSQGTVPDAMGTLAAAVAVLVEVDDAAPDEAIATILIEVLGEARSAALAIIAPPVQAASTR